MSLDPSTIRKLLFTPCTSKEDLHRFIKVFFGVDLPDCTVDPESNSNPMELVHFVYEKARKNDDENFNGVLFYAARDAGKTLSASVIQTLFAIHFNMSCCIGAALEEQAKVSAGYIKSFINKPILREFITAENERKIELTHFTHTETKEILTLKEYSEKPPTEQLLYKRYSVFIQVVVATIKSMNGFHAPVLTYDECDIAPEKPLQEGKMILSPGPEGQLPILMFTSTRKYAFGPVQKEINKAEETGIQIRHWNIIDVTQACPPSRHLPDEPKINLYIDKDRLKSVKEDEWMALPLEEQSRFVKKEAFAGCGKCKLFPMCVGRLATEQKCKSSFLKPIPHTINQFKKLPLDVAKAQLLCWRPGNEGLIYPNFSKEKHLITASQMAFKITGEQYPDNFSKNDLIKLAKDNNLPFYSGMDFGYTHFFAVVTGFLLGNQLFVIDVIGIPHLEDMEKVELCKRRIQYLNPVLFPDPASPQTIKLFRKNGFVCKNFKKDVLGGIEIVRMKLNPVLSPEPELFLLKGDDQCEDFSKDIMEYNWVLDVSGNPSDVPNDKNDDRLDALRYLCQNLFGVNGKVRVGDSIQYADYTEKDLNKNWMQEEIRKRVDSNQAPAEGLKGGKGGFKFSF